MEVEEPIVKGAEDRTTQLPIPVLEGVVDITVPYWEKRVCCRAPIQTCNTRREEKQPHILDIYWGWSWSAAIPLSTQCDDKRRFQRFECTDSLGDFERMALGQHCTSGDALRNGIALPVI